MSGYREITEEDIRVIPADKFVKEEESKPSMSTLDKLLAKDLSEFKTKSVRVEVKRLSEVIGEPFIVQLRLLNPTLTKRIEDIRTKIGMDEDGNPDVDFNFDKAVEMTLIESVYTLEGRQLFKDSSLRKKFNAHTNNELVNKLLTPGEKSKLYKKYENMAGFNKTSIEEIKN